MAVSEQTDSLRVLGSDPTNYLISPRILACMVATPILNLLCFCMGENSIMLEVCLSTKLHDEFETGTLWYH